MLLDRPIMLAATAALAVWALPSVATAHFAISPHVSAAPHVTFAAPRSMVSVPKPIGSFAEGLPHKGAKQSSWHCSGGFQRCLCIHHPSQC